MPALSGAPNPTEQRGAHRLVKVHALGTGLGIHPRPQRFG
jgi:hypothetical protein